MMVAADRPALVGRKAELAELARRVQDAREGRGSALVVRGEPGVGKTQLLAAAVAEAGDFAVLSVAGVQFESDLAYGALALLLTPLLDGLDALPAVQAGSLRAALGLAPGGAGERLATFAAVVGLLAGAAARRPLLIVVDDLQWCDAASREAILFAARRLGSDAAMFVLAVRQRAGDESLAPGLPELTLAGLGLEAALALLDGGADAVSPAVARTLWEQTAGNPLALAEIPRHLSAEQRLGRLPLAEPLPVGPRLEESFAATAAQLPASCREALLVAAASYTGATDAIFAALAQRELTPAALHPAEEAGLITIAEGGLRWRHPLVRSAVYHAAAGPLRRSAHAALASAGAERLSDHRAWHRAAAASAPDEEVAAALETLAGEAIRRGAPATALQAIQGAARLSPGEHDRARRELAGAEQAVALGRFDAALGLLDSARGRTDDPQLRAGGEVLRARVEMLRGNPHAAYDRLVAIAESVQDHDPAFAAAAMTEAVFARTTTGPIPEYRAIAERAFALAQPVGGETEATAALALGCGLVLSAQTAEGLELFDRYGAIAETSELWLSAPELYGMYACLYAAIERFDVAERLFTRIVANARERGAVRVLPYPLSGRALVDLHLGRWPAALAGAQEAVELSREMQSDGMLASSLAALAQVEACLGRVAETRAHATESLAICKALNAWAVEPEPVLALAALALSLGEHEAAAGVWQQTTVDIREWVLEPGWEHLDDIMIEAIIRVGRHAQAERELDHLEAKAARTGRSWAHAVAARCRGLLAGAEDMDEHFRAALRWHDAAPLPFDRARTELCYGERLRRARRRVDAREQLGRASAVFHALGPRCGPSAPSASSLPPDTAARRRPRSRPGPS